MQHALLILLFTASYLLFAGGPTWTLVPLLGIAALAVAVAPSRTLAFPRTTRAFDLSLIAVLAAVGIQAVPMPPILLSVLSPHATALAAATRLTPVGSVAPAWRPLSINPWLTLVSLSTAALGVLTFWVARGVFNAGGHTRAVLKAITVVGTVAAAMAIVQKAVAPRLILFVLAPDMRSASPFGAFVNRNHFAGWLLLVVAPVIGYAIARHETHARRGRWRESIGQVMSSGMIFTYVAAAVMVSILLLTLSRSGMASLSAAALVGWRMSASRQRGTRVMPMLLGLAGVAAVSAVLFVDPDRWSERLEQSFGPSAGFSRITIWRESLPLAKDFWLVGTGAGTYSDAMTVYQQTRLWVGSMQNWAHFNNAHSHFVQVVCEGGLLLAIPVLACIVTLFVLGMRAARADKGEMFWVRVGAAAGLAALLVQSIWEVALIMPANAVMTGILAALLLYERTGSTATDTAAARHHHAPAPRPLRMAR